MKKTISVLLIIAVIATFLLSLTACYVSKPDTMEHLVGTYHLAFYTRKPKDAPAETEPTDMIKEKGITAYLVVKSDGNGYFVYKDNDTPVYAKSVKIDFTFDSEDAERVKEIRYTDGLTDKGDGYPGKGRETLGLNFGKKDKKLTYTMPAVFGRDFSQTVRYEKVSDATDLSYASAKTGSSLKAADYELNGLGVLYEGYYADEFPYVYYLYDIHTVDKKADLYYALKEDEVPHVERDLAVSWAHTEPTAENNFASLTVTIGDKTYQRSYPLMGNYLYANVPATETTPQMYISLNGDTREISEIIESCVSDYSQYKEMMEEQLNQAE